MAIQTAGQCLIAGSSKDFYTTSNPEVLRVVFKDKLHGANAEATIEGTGRLREEFCYWFYRLLEQHGIPTHLAKVEGGSALLDRGILVQKMDMVALELVMRYVARGSVADAHKLPLFEAGTVFENPVPELHLKWKAAVNNLPYDQLSPAMKAIHGLLSKTPLRPLLLEDKRTVDDPPQPLARLFALHHQAKDARLRGHLVADMDEHKALEALIIKVNTVLRDFLASQGWILEDSKFEAGVRPNAPRIFTVADELTQDSSRIRNAAGESLTKDLFRQRKSKAQIYDGYAQLTEAIKNHVR